jgi:hypothetical protein
MPGSDEHKNLCPTELALNKTILLIDQGSKAGLLKKHVVYCPMLLVG